jgi:methylenetetrahydrofolate reductase (NADPH)
MRVIEHLERASGPLISFEIIPPLRGGNLATLLQLIEDRARFEPPFNDITSHAAPVSYEETTTGLERRVKRKRPGTLGVCALIQNKYQIDAVPHVLCTGFTREETEDFLIEIKYLGIDNVLAIRGDESGYEKPLKFGRTSNKYAIDLVQQIAAMNEGVYLEKDLLDAEPSSFCIGVAGYPEKHFEAPNMQADLRSAKGKIEAGAEYIVTQMFFDNAHYFRYLEACREAGIEAPVIPGVKILSTQSQLQSLPRTFFCEIPSALADEVSAAPADRAADVGVEWAIEQAQGLIDAGAPAIHFYVMANAKAVTQVVERLKVG